MSAPAREVGGARRRGRPPRGVLVAAAVVAVLGVVALVAWPLGGWDTVALRSDTLPELALDETFDGHHYATSVQGAWVGTVHPNGDEAPEGEEFLFVMATVRNDWIETDLRSFSLFDVELPDGLDLETPTIHLVSDGTWGGDMQPGIVTPVRYTWTVPAGTIRPGDTLVLGIVDGTSHRAQLTDDVLWDDEVVVTVPVVLQPSDELRPIGGRG